MTEDQHISQIYALKRTEREVSPATMARIDFALVEHPNSPRLWCLRGDCIQRGPEDSPYSLEEALSSYERALEIDPKFAEAHESVGYYFDVVSEDLARAQAAFNAAIEFGGGPRSYHGLARVMSERGHSREEVLALLDKCPDQDSSVIQEIRSETLRGEWEPTRKSIDPAQMPKPTRLARGSS